MQKWEYFRIRLHMREWDVDFKEVAKELRRLSVTEMLNKLGDEGWELVSSSGEYGDTFTFKRPKQ